MVFFYVVIFDHLIKKVNFFTLYLFSDALLGLFLQN